MFIKKSLISLAVASLLVGCGSSSDSSKDKTITPKNIVCIDTNNNANCEASEKSLNVESWENFDTSKLSGTVRSINTSSFAYNSSDGLVLTASSNSSKISPWSTLLNNEIMNNPKIKDEREAKEYLLKALNLSEKPSISDEKALEKLIRKSIKNNKGKNKAAILSSLVNKIVEMKTISSSKLEKITLNEDDILSSGISELKLSEMFVLNSKDAVEKQMADGWLEADDATVKYLSAKNGHIVAGSVYHNALIVIDNKTKTSKYNVIASLKGATEDDPDATSGASENYIKAVSITSDGKTIYANIPPKKIDSKDNDKNTFGLYKVNVNDKGEIYDSILKGILFKSFLLSDDDSLVLAYDNTNNFIIYDKDLNEKNASEIEGINSYALSSDNQTIYASFSNDDGSYISKINTKDLEVNSSKIELDFEVNKIFYVNESKLVAIDEDNMNIAIINPSTNEIITQNTLDIEVGNIAISPNGKRLVNVKHHGTDMTLISLGNEIEVEHIYKLSEDPRAAYFLDDNTIIHTKGDTNVAFVKIEDTGVLVSLEKKVEKAFNKLRSNINSGYLNYILEDIKLPTRVGSMSVLWESNIVENLTIDGDSGKVKRPSTNVDSKSGKLTATITSKFRGEDIVSEKTMDIRIIKESKEMIVKSSLKTSEEISFMSSNDEGNILITTSENKLNTYLVSKDGELIKKTIEKSFENGDIISSRIINNNAIIISTKDDTSKIFSVIIKADGTLEDEVKNVLDIDGEVIKLDFNTEKTLAVVLVQKDDVFRSEIYSISADGSIIESNTIAMAKFDYKDDTSFAINNDGSIVYERDSSGIHMNSKDSNHKFVAMNDIKSVTYFANRVFSTSKSGLVYSFNEKLEDLKIFSIGTQGRIYSAQGASIDNNNYLFISLRKNKKGADGIYKLDIAQDGELMINSFAEYKDGAVGVSVSKNGKSIFFLDSDEKTISLIKE